MEASAAPSAGDEAAQHRASSVPASARWVAVLSGHGLLDHAAGERMNAAHELGLAGGSLGFAIALVIVPAMVIKHLVYNDDEAMDSLLRWLPTMWLWLGSTVTAGWILASAAVGFGGVPTAEKRAAGTYPRRLATAAVVLFPNHDAFFSHSRSRLEMADLALSCSRQAIGLWAMRTVALVVCFTLGATGVGIAPGNGALGPVGSLLVLGWVSVEVLVGGLAAAESGVGLVAASFAVGDSGASFAVTPHLCRLVLPPGMTQRSHPVTSTVLLSPLAPLLAAAVALPTVVVLRLLYLIRYILFQLLFNVCGKLCGGGRVIHLCDAVLFSLPLALAAVLTLIPATMPLLLVLGASWVAAGGMAMVSIGVVLSASIFCTLAVGVGPAVFVVGFGASTGSQAAVLIALYVALCAVAMMKRCDTGLTRTFNLVGSRASSGANWSQLSIANFIGICVILAAALALPLVWFSSHMQIVPGCCVPALVAERVELNEASDDPREEAQDV